MDSTRKWVLPSFGLLIIVYAGSCFAPSARAGDSAPMKCAANQERVWVYESLGSFDVTAKLKCGETVEIIGRVKGFVKIHSASGVEGYVPDSTFPNLPPLEDDSNKTPASAATLAQAAAKAHARSTAAAAPSVSAPVSVASNPVPAGIVPSSAPAVVSVASSVAPAPVAVVMPPHAPAQPVSTAAPVEVVLSTAADVRPSATVASANSTPVASPAVTNAQPAPPSMSAPMKKAAITTNTSSTQPASVSAHSANSTARTVNSASKTSGSSSSASKPSSPKSNSSQPPAAGSTHSTPATTPAAPPAVPNNSKAPENTASNQSSHPVASLHSVAATVESEDFPDAQPESESADPACQIFFSAYGLTPDQFKWLAQNRKKKFANVCPAPDTSHVDFVIIFTHDIDFYGNTLPSPVHRDMNGFSDFSPMTMLDTTVTPLSEAEKARREYVYVFTMKRGAFDPSRFSPRRRYQFTKAESNSLTSSHASSRTVEDAFRFMEEQGPIH